MTKSTKKAAAVVTVAHQLYQPKNAKAPRPYVMLAGVPNGKGGKELWVSPELAEAIAAVADELRKHAAAVRKLERESVPAVAAPVPAAESVPVAAVPAGVDPSQFQAMMAAMLQQMMAGGQIPTAAAPAVAPPAAAVADSQPAAAAANNAAPAATEGKSPAVAAAIAKAQAAAGARR